MHSHSHNHWMLPAISLTLLITGMSTGYFFPNLPFWFLPLLFLFAYLPVAYSVLQNALKKLFKGDIFNEFFLMSIATIGAFILGEYAEGVAVMLFYTVGELVQEAAVKKSRNAIRKNLDQRKEKAIVLKGNEHIEKKPEEVAIGEILLIKHGERILLDGELLSENCQADTSALSGESAPKSFSKGEELLSGMLNTGKVIQLKVKRAFADSRFTRILNLIEVAGLRKSKTQLMISRLARIYTPLVTGIAVTLVLGAFIFDPHFELQKWLYRALVFLVISCPCALLVSVPLGYFGGIGAASANGILLKGANFIDALRKSSAIYFDKTGTLTQGNFKVRKFHTNENNAEFNRLLAIAAAKHSTHPVASSIAKGETDLSAIPTATEVEEISGKGISAKVSDFLVLLGNEKLLNESGIHTPEIDAGITVVFLAVNGKYIGYFELSDIIRKDTKECLRKIKQLGITDIAILSGDRKEVVQKVANELGIKNYNSELLPDEKYRLAEQKINLGTTLIYVGDGINDAPVLALADTGITLGGMSSDVAIENADVVINSESLTRIPLAIEISKATHQIIIQNIVFALTLKCVILLLGALGYASLWAAVFADVGVALLAIANAVRIQYMFKPNKEIA